MTSTRRAAYPCVKELLLHRFAVSVAALTLLVILLPAPSGASPSGLTHARHVLAFFRSHPKQASTSVGRRAIFRAAAVLDAEVRSLQAARAVKTEWPTPPSWFVTDMQCIGLHESHNGADPNAHGNLYGMLQGWAQAGGSGSPGDASPQEQLYRTWVLYQWALRNYGYGWSPWSTHGYCGL